MFTRPFLAGRRVQAGHGLSAAVQNFVKGRTHTWCENDVPISNNSTESNAWLVIFVGKNFRKKEKITWF